jgi:hypothetical protein
VCPLSEKASSLKCRASTLSRTAKEEASGQKFVPEKETERTFSGKFLTPFLSVRCQRLRLEPKTRLFLAKSGQKGGVPFRPDPFFGVVWKKSPKNGFFRVLASMADPRWHILGLAVAERVSAVRESGLRGRLARIADNHRGGHWSKIRARKRD